MLKFLLNPVRLAGVNGVEAKKALKSFKSTLLSPLMSKSIIPGFIAGIIDDGLANDLAKDSK